MHVFEARIVDRCVAFTHASARTGEVSRFDLACSATRDDDLGRFELLLPFAPDYANLA